MIEKKATTDSSFLGAGWAFPPAFDNATGRLQMTSGVSNINQSIDTLLQTMRGSRSMLPDFGCNLFSYLFQRLDATLEGEIVQSVKVCLLNSEPRIVVENVTVSQGGDGATIDLSIEYRIKLTNTRHNKVFPFSLLEATNLDLGI